MLTQMWIPITILFTYKPTLIYWDTHRQLIFIISSNTHFISNFDSHMNQSVTTPNGDCQISLHCGIDHCSELNQWYKVVLRAILSCKLCHLRPVLYVVCLSGRQTRGIWGIFIFVSFTQCLMGESRVFNVIEIMV